MDLFNPFEYCAPYIKLEDCKNTTIITLLDYIPPDEARIKKLNKNEYLVLSSGEICEYEHGKTKTKADNKRSIRRAFNELKKLINCNYDSTKNVRFFTLTYAENMQDNARISDDWRQFVKRCKKKYGDFRYIYVKEKQERGAWHLHGFFFFDHIAPFIPNEELAAYWGQGFVKIEAIKDDINNLGNYLCAYLTDDKETGKKGARLLNYESNIRLYNTSRNIRRPIVSPICYEDYNELLTNENFVLLSENDSVIDLPSGKTLKSRYQLFRNL